jgi:hypothetical protein
MLNSQSCLSIQYNSQIVTCETARNSTDPLNLGTGNLASGLTDLIKKKVVDGNIIQKLPQSPVPITCNRYAPQISPYAGGNTSSSLLQSHIARQQACTETANRLLALQRVPPVCNTVPRFAQYQRRGAPTPCTPPPPEIVIPYNPAVPDAIDGPCTNVIGISVTKH